MLESSILIGMTAGVLGVSGFGYQLYRMMKSAETKAMTYPMMSFLGIGIAMWASYGIVVDDSVVYTTNILMTLILAVMVLYKIKTESGIMLNIQS